MLGKCLKNTQERQIEALPPEKCLAKLVVDEKTGDTKPGISVAEHCLITGFVAEVLCKSLIDNVKRILTESAPFFASIHDVGKISPDFQRMIYTSWLGSVKDFPQLQNANENRAKRKDVSFHGKVSQVSIESSFPEQKMLATIEGMHHGFKPNFSLIAENRDIYGGENWTALRHQLIDDLKRSFPCSCANNLSEWNQACVIGGFITVADWIASGGYFGNILQNHSFSKDDLRKKAHEAVHNAGFIPLSIKQGLQFEDIFGFSPRKIQSDLFESVSSPGVYVLEAPMGLGKTEAALYAAYKMLEKGLASGIYFGLPTQLTSNKIYERVESFLKKIVGEESSYCLKLLHSSAWLEEDSFGEDAKIGKSWFDSKKRGILAPFAVGTIDQALMAAMNVKHSMVRAFGLAGKVVILDEVHSYDSYTGTIMNALVDELKHIGCTVIILSATLTSSQKKKILDLPLEQVLNESYPLISSQTDKFFSEISSLGESNRKVSIQISKDDKKAFDVALEKAENGEQVLWIENTVADAQNVYKKLAAKSVEMGLECGLIHSRFIKKQRSEIENKWVSLYGKNGYSKRSACGRILVGTQVLEQSIDIDADYLITRICPMDMLLQRIGRLWRHRENDKIRPLAAKCETLVLSPVIEDVIKSDKVFGVTGVVYSPYVLSRTLDVLKHIDVVNLPNDIRGLLESVYQERQEEGILAKMRADLIVKQEHLKGLARVGLSSAISTLPESAVQTRYSDVDTVSVLLLEFFEVEENGVEIKFWNESEAIVLPKYPSSERQKRELSKKIVEHCVIVAKKDAPPIESRIKYFENYVYLGNAKDKEDDEECMFRAIIVDKDCSFRDLNRNRIEILNDGNTKKMLYTKSVGYKIEK
ncbi:MAG: CRISPR-associated helicase Cas3' [Fibrobacter sp.]|nr:CRISPR-associated helicase Cas3' [Fibrobacter sp.]